jgi:tripartite-type tricarboxylate transporter receptor subunit TctC
MPENGMDRRRFLQTTGGLAGTALVAGCLGGDGDGTPTPVDYPSGEIRNIVPYSTGGGFDAYARLSEPYWADELGAEVVTENVTGGGGVNALTQVWNAEPDGHTMVIAAPGEQLPSQIGQDVAYDLRDMSHIGFLTQTPCAIIFREDAGIDDWDDMVNNMDDLNWATQGVGTMAHVGMYILAELTGEFATDDVNFVHYAGTGEVLAGLERGEANAFLITAGDSGAKVVKAIEGTEMFLVFSDSSTYGSFFNEQDVDVGYWGADLDVDGMDQMATVSAMRRFYTGPPDVPDAVLEIQRDAFENIINDQEFIDEAAEAGRPVLEPDDHEAVDEVIQESYELLNSEPYRSTLEEALGS